MTTALLQPSTQSDQRVILEGVTWQTYQVLLEELGDHRSARLAYDQGILEIVVPSDIHEIINRLLASIATALTNELGMKIKGYGSTTLNREDLQRGIEPDSCFYIQNVDQIIGRRFNISTALDVEPERSRDVEY